MALFTDFFPQGGGSGATNPPVTQGTGTATISALVANTSLTLNFATALTFALEAGDSVNFQMGTTQYLGIVVGAHASGATAVPILIVSTTGLANTNTVSTTFSRGGQSLNEGDVITSGDTTIQGALTVEGDTTLNSETIVIGDGTDGTTTVNGDTFDVNSETITLGVTGGTTTIDGTLNIDSNEGTHVANQILGLDTNGNVVTDGVTTLLIDDDAVTAAKIASDVAGIGLSQVSGTGAGAGSLIVNPTIAGNGLTYDATEGRLDVSSIQIGATWAYTSATAQTEAAAKTAIVAAFNAATADANGTNGGFTVLAGQTYTPGDLILLTHMNTATPAVSVTESFIFTGTNAVTAPADITEARLVDITHVGDTVTAIDGSAGQLSFSARDASGSVTAALALGLNADTIPVSSGTGNNALTNSRITQGVATRTIAANILDVIAHPNLANTAILAFATPVPASIIMGATVTIGGILFTVTTPNTGVGGLNATIPAGTTSAQLDALGSPGVVDFMVAGNAPVVSIGSGATTAQRTGLVVSDLIGATGSIDRTVVVNAEGKLEAVATAPNLQVDANTVPIGNSGGTNFDPSPITLATAGNLEIAENTTITSSHGLTISDLAGTGERNVVVNAAGLLQVGAGGGGAGFELKLPGATATAAQNEADGGDLVVLDQLVANVADANRTIYIPATATPGTSIKISNLSTARVSNTTGNQRWRIGTGSVASPSGNITVMTRSLTGFLTLDDPTASFTLIYVNAAIGWIILGAN